MNFFNMYMLIKGGVQVEINELNKMFNANAVAVIGASNNSNKTGYQILKNLIDGGYKGKIYPINHKDNEILGLKAYSKISDINGDIDLAVIVIPGPFIPEVMKEMGEKNVNNAIIISGGFKEIGNNDLENEVIEAAKKYNIAFVGPNCQGINYTNNNLCASWPLITTKGPLSIIAQSGTVAATFGTWADQDGIGTSGIVSLGNKTDLNELDFIDFFLKDDKTKVIALNIEGLKDGKQFMEIAKNNDKKDIVVLKPGRTKKGIKVAQSHTKSVSGSDVIFDAACKQSGVIRAYSITELYDYSKALALLQKPKGNRVMVITSSGGCGILATDIFEEQGVEVVDLNPELANKLKLELPPHCVVSNPLDLTGDTDAYRYEKCVNFANEYDDIDMFLLIFGDPIPNACDVVSALTEKANKPITVCYLGGGEIEREETILMHKKGIPVFPTPERAAKAISILLRKNEKEVIK